MTDPKDPNVRPNNYVPPKSTEELLRRYGEGERYFESAYLGMSNLIEAKLEGANLRGATMSKVNMHGADLRETKLCKADLRASNIGNGTLRGADLREAKLNGLVLKEADLSGANLSEADLSEAYLIEANLSNTNLRKAILSEANLSKADLREADLSEVNLNKTRLEGAKFQGANFNGATLPEIKKGEWPKFGLTCLREVKSGDDSQEILDFSEGLDAVEKVAKHCRNLFIVNLSAALIVFLKLISLSGRDLVIGDNKLTLPIVGDVVSAEVFIYAMPILLLAIYVYFHMYLRWLWLRMARLPAVFPDGRSLVDACYPWLLSSILSLYIPHIERPKGLERLPAFVAQCLAWFGVPIVLLVFQIRVSHSYLWRAYLMFIISLAGILIATIFLLSMLRIFRYTHNKVWTKKRALRKLAPSLILTLLAVLWFEAVHSGAVASADFLSPYVVAPNAEFYRRDFDRINLRGAYLSGTNFGAATLRYAELSWANLSGADLSGANLSGADLTGANLTGADLRGANLSGADLREADLRRANLSEADLSGAKYYDQPLTEYFERTKFPKGFDPEKRGMICVDCKEDGGTDEPDAGPTPDAGPSH